VPPFFSFPQIHVHGKRRYFKEKVLHPYICIKEKAFQKDPAVFSEDINRI
jgi:hypothetical protein